MIKRKIEIKKHIRKNKVLIIYGPRQVGKTTLVKEFLKTYKGKYKMTTGDDIPFTEQISKCSLQQMIKMFSNLDLLIIDEAQKIPNIGRALKLIVDNIENISVIVTGSSSFELANRTGESLTGRKNILELFPISQGELITHLSEYETMQSLEDILRYGSYPNIITLKTYKEKEERIREIANSYLLKDILSFDLIKDSKKIRNLLKLLSLQIGQLVSLNELGKNLELDGKTVARYLDLLEKSFVIFSLGGFSRNSRKEIIKMNKYYFYDTGIRNALISNFNTQDMRNDMGQLWENFILSERRKRNEYKSNHPNYYFWRTHDKHEIDLIEETGGYIYGYEIKFGEKKVKCPTIFLETYENSKFKIINKKNYIEFVT